jgi:hypothetical protein
LFSDSFFSYSPPSTTFIFHSFASSPLCPLLHSLSFYFLPSYATSSSFPSSSITFSVLAYKTVYVGSHTCITKFLKFIHHLVCETETTIQIPVTETDSLSETMSSVWNKRQWTKSRNPLILNG